MKKFVLVLMIAISLVAFSASKSKKTKKTKKTTTSKTKTKKKDTMNMERFSFHDLADYPDPKRPAPQNHKKVLEEYFKKNPRTRKSANE